MVDRAQTVWTRLNSRLRFRLATQEVLDRLAKIGVVIYPYHFVYAPIVTRFERERPSEDLQFKLLQRHDAPLIAAVPERPRVESEVRERMAQSSCIAVVEGDELLAYSWIARGEIRIPASANALCKLPADCGYIFDTYVRPKARGRKLAVHLRYEAHRLLAEQGVAYCCAIIMKFNASSRRVRSKLGSIETELRLLLRLGRLPGLDMRLWRRPWMLETPAVALAFAKRPGVNASG